MGIFALLTEVAPADTTSPATPWAVIIAVIGAITTVTIAVINGRRKPVTPEEHEEARLQTAAETSVEAALESWDRLIGTPLRNELDDVRKRYNALRDTHADIRADIAVVRKELKDAHDAAVALRNENHRLLSALAEKGIAP